MTRIAVPAPTSPVRRYDALLFDFDHTLLLDHRVELRVLHDMYQELRPGDSPGCSIFMAQGATAMEQFRAGRISIQQAMADTFKTVPGVDPNQLATSWMRRVVNTVPDTLEPLPGAVQLLQDLKQAGYRIGAVTNGWEALQQKKAELISFPGPVFVSDAMGCWKPDAKAFIIACQAMGVDPHRCAYIGDTPKADVVGAHDQGLTTIWVNELHQPYPEGLTQPDYEVQDVAQIRDLLLPMPGQRVKVSPP